tara:strand:+ start:128 stop:325 length:198 start_codon:yes stop_codon:yes gene_type:complete
MTTTTRGTELESVNVILSTIGESPLNSLSGSLPVDGTVALKMFYQKFQEKFNLQVGTSTLIIKVL